MFFLSLLLKNKQMFVLFSRFLKKLQIYYSETLYRCREACFLIFMLSLLYYRVLPGELLPDPPPPKKRAVITDVPLWSLVPNFLGISIVASGLFLTLCSHICALKKHTNHETLLLKRREKPIHFMQSIFGIAIYWHVEEIKLSTPCV